MRVLVIDDSAVMRQILRAMLELEGLLEVDEAADAAEGLRHLSEQTYHLVITDWDMPGLSGLEFVRAIRRHRSVVELPIVMVTSVDHATAVVEAGRAGVNAYLVKPFDQATFQAKLCQVMTADWTRVTQGGRADPVAPRPDQPEASRIVGRD